MAYAVTRTMAILHLAHVVHAARAPWLMPMTESRVEMGARLAVMGATANAYALIPVSIMLSYRSRCDPSLLHFLLLQSLVCYPILLLQRPLLLHQPKSICAVDEHWVCHCRFSYIPVILIILVLDHESRPPFAPILCRSWSERTASTRFTIPPSTLPRPRKISRRFNAPIRCSQRVATIPQTASCVR